MILCFSNRLSFGHYLDNWLHSMHDAILCDQVLSRQNFTLGKIEMALLSDTNDELRTVC